MTSPRALKVTALYRRAAAERRANCHVPAAPAMRAPPLSAALIHASTHRAPPEAHGRYQAAEEYDLHRRRPRIELRNPLDMLTISAGWAKVRQQRPFAFELRVKNAHLGQGFRQTTRRGRSRHIRSTSRLVSLASSLDASGSRRLPVQAASSEAPEHKSETQQVLFLFLRSETYGT